MLVDRIKEMIDSTIAETVAEYQKTKESKDADGNYIQHPLESKTDDEKLASIYFGLREATLNVIPVTLIETSGSTADEFRPLDANRYIRVPAYPVLGNNLDIDEGLVYAVLYKALTYLWNGYTSYETKANAIYANYKDATRDYFLFLEDNDNTDEAPVYFRYSSDGTSWHDNFIDGDVYISFKQGDGVWSNAIRFVGQDGASGSGDSGASTFLELSDTPASYEASKMLAVNSDGDAIEFVDAPSGGGGGNPDFDNMSGTEDAQGDIVLDLLYANGNRAFHYINFTADGTLDISQADGENYDMEIGRIYTLQIFPNSNTVSIAFDALGDTSIDADSTNILQIVYDEWDIYVLSNNKYA